MRDLVIGGFSLGVTGLVALFGQTPQNLPTPQNSAQSSPPPIAAPAAPRQETITGGGRGGQAPRILKLDLTLSEPSDLKVQAGDRVDRGQILSDRTQQRTQIEGQLAQLLLSRQSIATAKILAPSAPAPVPPIAPLPRYFPLAAPTLAEQEAEISTRKAELDEAQAEVAIEEQKTALIANDPELSKDPAIAQHQVAITETLRRKILTAEAKHALAEGKLTSEVERFNLTLAKATAERQAAEYQHSLNLARRAETQNQQRAEFERSRSIYLDQVRDRDFKLAEIDQRIAQAKQSLAALAVVRSPFAGVIRRVKIAKQADLGLTAEVTLIVTAGSIDPSTLRPAQLLPSPRPIAPARARSAADRGSEPAAVGR